MRVLPAKAAAALVVALAVSLLVAPDAGAAAYYVGGGKGVRLAVRVVDRQIVWSKVRVLKHCLATDRGEYHYTESSEGLAGQVAIGSRGRFGWHSGGKTVAENGDESASAENVSGRIGPRRLLGRILSYGWFTSSEPPGTHSHGHCRGGGSGPPPPAHPTPVPITAHRRPEPPGLAFYFSEEKGGITTYFEVRGRRIVRAEVGAVHYCTGRHGRRYREDLLSPFRSPIGIGPSGGFKADESSEYGPYEVLRGRVGRDRITGNYGFETGFDEGPRCRTGGFDASLGKGLAIHFVALRR